jgi:hypothetical protein
VALQHLLLSIFVPVEDASFINGKHFGGNHAVVFDKPIVHTGYLFPTETILLNAKIHRCI